MAALPMAEQPASLADRGVGIGLGRFQLAADGLTGLGLLVASFVLVLVLSGIFSSFGERQVDFLPTTLPLWFRIVDALVIATTAGVTEEIVVRGYAQTRLEQLGAPDRAGDPAPHRAVGTAAPL